MSSGQPVRIVSARECRSRSLQMVAWVCQEVSLTQQMVHRKRGHFLTASSYQGMLDGYNVVLQTEAHSLGGVNWCIGQVLQLDLFKGLVATLNNECMAKDIGVKPFHTRHRQTFYMLCWHSMILQVLELLRKRSLASHPGVEWHLGHFSSLE